MSRTRRWFIGALSGLCCGFFLGTTLLLFGVMPLQSPVLTVLPAAGLVLGAAWGTWAPIGRRRFEPASTRVGLVQPAVPDSPRPLRTPGAGAGKVEPPPAET
jgi:hypothetical protein